MRILAVPLRKGLEQLMREIKVDPYGVKIMLPKAQSRLLKVSSLSNVSANILKQEMLSLGADAALARGSLTGLTRKTDCLLMANLSQLSRLIAKLEDQPFGLSAIGREINATLNNSQKNAFTLNAGKHKLNLGRHPCIMGILNITPDSFSGDGLLNRKVEEIVSFAQEMVRSGAKIIDVGAESSRPKAKPISAKEEIKRLLPVIKALAKRLDVPVSVDTYKPLVASVALDNGASIINDIRGLRDKKMIKVVRRHKAAVVIMHMLKDPRTMQDNPVYGCVIDEVFAYLKEAVDRALTAGIGENSIIIDPGIGFGKTVEHNLEILRRLSEFKSLGKPILVGTSRKSFLGKLLKKDADKRIFGTVASSVIASLNGASIIRTHDVEAVKDALAITEGVAR